MNSSSESAVVKGVRPALRRIAIVAFAILVPVAAYSLWDYVEIRRLVHEIERIRDKGEPVTEQYPRMSTEGAPTADAYYLAGAMLALHSEPHGVITSIRERLAQSNLDRQSLISSRLLCTGSFRCHAMRCSWRTRPPVCLSPASRRALNSTTERPASRHSLN